MKFFAKSLERKLVLLLILCGLLIAGMGYYVWQHKDETALWVGLLAMVVLVAVFGVKYYLDVVRPLHPIVDQMQLLITGKPFKKIYTDRIDEVGVVAYFFNQVTKGLGQASEGIKDRDRMVSELTIAAQLQRDILPLQSPVVPGLQVVAKNKPATELGGDSFNFINAGSRTYIYIGDVTGHGVAAGLIMTMVSSLINIFSGIYATPYEIVVNVNKYIKKHVKKAMFMTMVMLCWDNEKKTMSFVGAGHEHILVYHKDSGECEAILSGGVALGMVPDNSKVVVEKQLQLADGDSVILYSDGITEAKSEGGELYGLDRLKSAVVEYAAQYSAEGLNYHVAKDVAAFMGSAVQNDDMTLIVARRMDVGAPTEAVQDMSTNWKS